MNTLNPLDVLLGSACSKRTIEALVSHCKKTDLHYVYLLHRPNGDPFYVGKGQDSRIFAHEAEASGTSKRSHKLNVIRSIHRQGLSLQYSMRALFESNQEALAAERDLIQELGRYDQGRGPLTNQTAGGEGGLDPSEGSKERHRQTLAGDAADDPERAAANIFFAKFCDVASTPIKPMAAYGPSLSGLYKNRKYIGMMPRNAGALVAMAVAQGVIIRAGAELSRRFSMNGVEMVLENGCGRDMMVNGMIELMDDTPTRETMRITAPGANYALQSYDRRKLVSYGVLEE